jgi:PAS domain S-box-containing protein
MVIRARIWFTFLPLVLVAMLSVAYIAIRGMNRNYDDAVTTWNEISACRAEYRGLSDAISAAANEPQSRQFRELESRFAVRLENADQRVARFRLNISHFVRSFCIAIGLTLLVTSAAGYMMARRFSEPITDLRRRARAIAAGNLSVSATVAAPDELADLSTDIDTMRNRLQLQIRELDRQVAERTESLLQREGEFRAVFMASAVGLLRTDDAGHILDANPAIQRMLRYDAEDLCRLTVKDITYPADWETEKENLRALVDRQSSTVAREKRYVCKDGSLLWARVSLSAIRDGAGHPRFLIAVIADISEEKKSREALAAREREYRLLFSSMSTGFALHELLVDSDGRPRDYRFLDLNPAFEALTGLRAADAVGRTAIDVYGDALDPFWVETYGRVALSGQPETFEHHSREIGKDVYVTAYSPQHMRFAVLFTDITWRKQAEEERLRLERQMQHAQKLESLGVLTGGIAHDFNNLLMGILGSADLALNRLAPNDTLRAELDEIVKASKRAAELCRQMLAYSGRGKFVIEPIHLTHMVEDMRNMLDLSVAKTAHLVLNLQPDIPLVSGDATQLRQIVMNLVINASEAISPAAGVITIATGVRECARTDLQQTEIPDELPPGPYAFIEVRDTGCGLTPEVRERIFDPFFTTKFAGRGLGMAAVLGILRGHRGTIRISSEVGKGSAFLILLPISRQPLVPRADETGGHARLSGPRKGTILLADDEDVVRMVSRSMLERAGFTVMTAANGEEAVHLFESARGSILCVILDLTMPVMGGEEAFNHIRALSRDVPVIVSSGYDEHDIAPRFAGLGLSGFIQKPYTGSRLMDVVQSAIGD